MTGGNEHMTIITEFWQHAHGFKITQVQVCDRMVCMWKGIRFKLILTLVSVRKIIILM